jgi:hypothetical protein
MTLEQTTDTLMHWVRTSTEQVHLNLIEIAIQNCLVAVHSKSYPINEIGRAENVIIGAIKLRQIELDSIGEDLAKTRMYEQGYINAVHEMD